MGSENRTSNIINGIIAFGTLMAVWVSTCSLQTSNESLKTSNQALELASQSAQSSDATNKEYLKHIENLVNANRTTAIANQDLAINSTENLKLSSKIIGRQIGEFDRLKKDYLEENKPFISVADIQIGFNQAKRNLNVKVLIDYSGRHVLSVDSFFFCLRVKSYPKVGVGFDNYPFVNSNKRDSLLDNCHFSRVKSILKKDKSTTYNFIKHVDNEVQFGETLEGQRDLALWGEIYFVNFLTNKKNCFSFNYHIFNTEDQGLGTGLIFDIVKLWETQEEYNDFKLLFMPNYINASLIRNNMK